MDKGVPDEYLWLLAGTAGFNLLVIWLPFRHLKKGTKQNNGQSLTLPLAIFGCIGAGFMAVEVSLFQKLILYLGSPTISLAILLSSLLVGMGIGSYCGKRMYSEDIRKRLYVVSSAIVVLGILLFVSSPLLLSVSLISSLPFRSAACFIAVLPLAFMLGIPFPSCIQMLTLNKQDRYIPWLYGVNGSMSVLGSVLAVILSMLVGFTPAFFAGLSFYLCIPLLLFFSRKSIIWTSASSSPRLSSTDIA
jgi:predicted membrane-bound spermidine synthase